MFLYTIFPPEFIFDEDDCEHQSKQAVEVEIQRNGMSFLVSPADGGQMKINRLISTNPRDYLNPDWQPGSIMKPY